MSNDLEDDELLVSLLEGARAKPDAAKPADPIKERAKEALDDAREALLELTLGPLDTMELLAAWSVQSARTWELESLYYRAKSDLDGAAEASKQAVAQGNLAIKYSKATIVDRVLEIERRLDGGRQESGKIRMAAASRRK